MGIVADPRTGQSLADKWGPWDAGIDAAERLARLRSLRTLVHCFYGVQHPLVRSLFLAESQDATDLETALTELDRLPARDRRKILSTYASMIAYRAQALARRA